MKKELIAATDEHSHEHEIAFVEDFWTDQWAQRGFQEASRRQLKKRDEFKVIDEYLSKLAPGSRILDGGCGLGEWVVYYAAKGYEVVGLDISKKTVDILRQKFLQQQFVLGDIRQTGFPDGSFDAYFSLGTFEHFEEGLEPCFNEAYRILKPGGLLMTTVPFYNGFHQARDRRNPVTRSGREKPGDEPVRFYQWRLTKDDLQKLYQSSGFSFEHWEPIYKAVGLRRAIKFYTGLDRTSPFHLAIKALLYPLLPKEFIAHMQIAVGRKR